MNRFFSDLRNIIWFFIPPILILIFHSMIASLDVYINFPWVDIPMHFFGGASVAYAYFLTLNYYQKQNYIILNKIFRIVFVISLVSLTAISWEFFEFFAKYVGIKIQGDLPDTMFDLFLGLLGGFITVLFLNYKSLKSFSFKSGLLLKTI